MAASFEGFFDEPRSSLGDGEMNVGRTSRTTSAHDAWTEAAAVD
jgi:hypothetical protein